MKKILLLITVLYSTSCFSQYQSQVKSSSTFEYANKSFDMGIIGGVIGVQDDYSYGALGFNMTLYGIYADFMGWPKAHEDDVRVDKWHDKSSIAYHVGYQIPLMKYLRIIPIVGYAKVEEGTTNGWDWTVGYGGIVNKFTAEKKSKWFGLWWCNCY